jgi:hypothetical protein
MPTNARSSRIRRQVSGIAPKSSNRSQPATVAFRSAKVARLSRSERRLSKPRPCKRPPAREQLRNPTV